MPTGSKAKKHLGNVISNADKVMRIAMHEEIGSLLADDGEPPAAKTRVK